jgi:HlyD family secretion protein
MLRSNPGRSDVSETGSTRLILVGLIAFLTLSTAGCHKTEEVPASEVLVQVALPRVESIAPVIHADATLSPVAQAAIASKVTAPIKRFLVKRGAHVKAGQLLAVLENADLSAAKIDNEGIYTAAQAAYDSTTQAIAPEELSKAQLDVNQAKATLDLNLAIVNARTQLLAQGAIAGRDLDTAKASLVQSQSAFEIARRHLESVQKTSNQATLKSATGQLESARGKFLGAQAQLSYTEIRSPIEGYVTDRPLFAGETAAAGAPVITVLNTAELIAKVHIGQADAQKLSAGGTAKLKIPGVDEPYSAVITLISPALDAGSTTVEVWLSVKNPKNALKAGTPVQATITGQSVDNALVIPAEAVQSSAAGAGEAGGKFVLVLKADGTVQRRPVTLGIRTTQSVQVLSGISGKDTVVTTGAYGLDDGAKVKVGTASDSKPDAAKPAAEKSGEDK